MSFFNRFFSLNSLYPKITLIIIESWNKDRAYPTFIYLNTYAVVNVINPKHIAVKIYIIECFLDGIFKFLSEKILIMIKENKAPKKLDVINEVVIDDKIITFFMKTASIAEKISA